jgi:hypothetical protein
MKSRLKSWSMAGSLIACTWLIVACGGGLGSDDGEVPPDVARLDCLVTDASTGKSVPNARVDYQAKTTSFSTTSNPDGSCQLNIPATEVAGVVFPAATVTKPDYEPQAILCRSLKAGDRCVQEARLVPLADNIAIPVGGDTVTHLGDDQFEGSINSQFQKATDGSVGVFPIAEWSDKVRLAGVKTATVYLDAKGWQTNFCKNLIEIVGDAGTATLPGGVSPSAGSWGGGRDVPFVFSIADVGMLQAQLRIAAGECNGTADLDDFEVNRIRVEFN